MIICQVFFLPYLIKMLKYKEFKVSILSKKTSENMKFSDKLARYKKEIDRELENRFDKMILEAEKKDVLMTEALLHTKKIALAGGKRIRGALLVNAYLGFGGKEKKKIMKIAAAIELVHLFLLVHDDIIDRGDLRHGQVTLHRAMAKKYAKKKVETDDAHFGNSVAIIVGEMLYCAANELIATAGFSAGITLEALADLQKLVKNTIIGQSQDILIALSDHFDEKEILSMYENKTARYTFEGPLKLGAIFAGCSDRKTLHILNDFALPLGVAFQIQDDQLGIFASQKEIGKDCTSDIVEGKKTLLVAKTVQLCDKKQRIEFLKILGKAKIESKEIKNFQRIIIECGAKQYCDELIREFFAKGKKEIEKVIMLGEQKDFLLGLVEYLLSRSN